MYTKTNSNMSKTKVTKDIKGNYYLEVSNDLNQFLTIKIKLTKEELINLNSEIKSELE